MKVRETQTADGSIVIEATASPQEVDNAIKEAEMAFARSMGLQPDGGKTIQEIAKEQLGVSDVASIIGPQVLSYLVPFALDAKGILPASMSTPKATTELVGGRELSFVVDIMPKPNYELTSYEPVSLEIPAFEFDESIVDQQIDAMASRYVSFETDDDVAEDYVVGKGDSVRISLETKSEGKKVEGLSFDARVYTAGMGYMPEGFEAELMGMKIGETKEFSFEGPGVDDSGNPVTESYEARVTVLDKQREVKPNIDDEWLAQNMPMVGSLEALRKNMREQLHEQAKTEYDAQVMQLAASEMAKRFEGSIADEIYEYAMDNLVNTIRRDLQAQGKTWNQYVDENGGEQTVSMMLMMQVRAMLTQGFALDAVFRQEGLVLTDEDYEAACASMNPQIPPTVLRKQMEEAGKGFALREAAERLKANKWLVESANITYI